MTPTIRARLEAMRDLDYAAFQAKLIPTVDRSTILGVRTPLLRRYAKELYGTPEATAFMTSLPHETFEENNLHAFLIEQIKNFHEAITATEAFLPYVDNWATCDQLSPKALSKDLSRLLAHIRAWLSSEHTYTVRYGMGMLMRYYLKDTYAPAYPAMVADAAARHSGNYYIDMMAAWYFATALAFRYDEVLPYLTEYRLPVWIHNKAIQKARESYRVREDHKAQLAKLKR